MVNLIKYSLVVPVYNEDGNVVRLDNEIKEVMDKLAGSYEIIYVNDGSNDDTLQHLKKLKRVNVIDLNRNYGQSIALDAGFKAAKGEFVISMDGDLQNDPKDIPRLLKKLQDDNLDVVAGWRKKRKDKSGIIVLTRTGRMFRHLLINDKIHDSGCTLRVYRKRAIKSLDLWGEMHRYIVALLRWKGFRIGELEVNHRARVNGKTKYGYGKGVRGLIDLLYIWFISKYSNRPLHAFGYLSILSFLFGILALCESVYARIFLNLSLNRNGWFFLGFFFVLMSILFFSFGILIDLALRVHLNSPSMDKRYYVREVLEL